MIGVDSHAYWLAARDPGSWYTRAPATRDAYLYSPAFAQALWAIGHLPWEVFQAVWAAMQIGVLAWLLAPLGWTRALPIGTLLCTDVILGNVYIFFAAALVLVVRGAGGAVALPLLTKVFPGVVALYYVGRRDWGAIGRTLLTTAFVLGVSAVISPHAWLAWFRFLADAGSSGPGFALMALRFGLAGALALLAARRRLAWLLAPAMILALPFLGGYGPVAVAAALPRLLRRVATEASPGGRQEQNIAVIRHRDLPAASLL
jgi:hypothetical protein